MKRLVLLFVIGLGMAHLRAQPYNSVRTMEYEIGLGANKAGAVNGGTATAGLQVFIETRRNFSDTPFDIGAQVMLSNFSRKADNQGVKVDIRHRIALCMTGDYNFRRWKRVAPFVGIGVGYANIEATYERPEGSSNRWSDTSADIQSPVFTPRIGAEFFSHLRITAEYRIMKSDYSFFGVNVGVVIGGGHKR